jgi:hypothetical protein
MIYRMFTGHHIDLSKIVAISQPKFVDMMGNGGYFACFTIDVQLMDKPLEFWFDLCFDIKYRGIDGEFPPKPEKYGSDDHRLSWEQWTNRVLGDKIEQLVKVWQDATKIDTIGTSNEEDNRP